MKYEKEDYKMPFFEDEIDEVVRQFGHFAKQFGFWKGPTGEGENRRRGSPVIDK